MPFDVIGGQLMSSGDIWCHWRLIDATSQATSANRTRATDSTILGNLFVLSGILN